MARHVCYCHFLTEGGTPRFMTYGNGSVRVYEGGAKPPLIDELMAFRMFLNGMSGLECFVTLDVARSVVKGGVQFPQEA